MTTQISTFNFKSNPVRIETINNEPYFALKDVCLALAIQVASPERFSLDPQGVTLNVIPTTSGNQELTFINEPNLYRIIFKSRKAEAVDFQNWVFEEVLPQIRKTGKYALQNAEQIAPLTLNPSQAELETLFKLLNYAGLYRDFVKMAVTQPDKIHWSRVCLNDEKAGVLFAFKPDLDNDINQGLKLLGRYAGVTSTIPARKQYGRNDL